MGILSSIKKTPKSNSITLSQNLRPKPHATQLKKHILFFSKHKKRERERVWTYKEVGKIDNGPGHARRAAKDGEDKEPREEEDKDVGGPNPRVCEPFCVPIQIRRWLRLHV